MFWFCGLALSNILLNRLNPLLNMYGICPGLRTRMGCNVVTTTGSRFSGRIKLTIPSSFSTLLCHLRPWSPDFVSDPLPPNLPASLPSARPLRTFPRSHIVLVCSYLSLPRKTLLLTTANIQTTRYQTCHGGICNTPSLRVPFLGSLGTTTRNVWVPFPQTP